MKLKFANIGALNAEIHRLESMLGLPENKCRAFTFFNTKKGHDYLAELEEKLPKGAAPSIAATLTAERAKTVPAAIGILRAQAEPQLFTCVRHSGEVVSADAAEKCPRCGTGLYPMAVAGRSIIEQHEAITDPVAKTAFYRANKAAFNKEFDSKQR